MNNYLSMLEGRAAKKTLARAPGYCHVKSGVWSLLLTALIGALDYATGFELRLGALYLIPISLATWKAGRSIGLGIAAAASLCWLFSFNSTHNYTRPALFYWDGIVMVCTFAVFVILLARLHLALTQADERFVRLIGEIRAGIYVVDQTTGEVIYANQRLAEMLNADPLTMSSSELHQFFSGTEETITPTVSPNFTSRERRNPASGRWYLVQSGSIPWRRGRTVTLRVVTDITDRRHAQLLRRENQDMLKRTARLSELAEATSFMAHEINQPLMAIASYNDACLRLLSSNQADHGKLMQALEKSRAQAIRAGDIVSRMRNAIRCKRPQPVLCETNEIVREALELMGTRIEDDCVVANVSLAEHLPPIHADRFLLVQVVVNLLENAVDAMNSLAQAHRQLDISTSQHDNGTITVAIADHGTGIPETIGDNLYTPFLSTKPHGLGLGLSICRSVVEAHGGRLWHSPNPDGGTIFQFTIATELE